MKDGVRHLDTQDESCCRQFVTPSREMQVWQIMTRLRETNDGLYDNMLRLFEQRCVGHTRPLDDDEALSSIGGMCFGVENDCTLSSSNCAFVWRTIVHYQAAIFSSVWKVLYKSNSW